MTPNLAAFLHVIREGETDQTAAAYSMINGGGRFLSFEDHPYHGQSAPPGRAAGAYQDIPHTWEFICTLIGPGDFSPARQDEGNAALCLQKGAGAAIEAGDVAEAIRILGATWVSLPGLGIDRAKRVFQQFGGILAGEAAPAPQPTQGADMGAIALPLLAQLLPQVLTLFSGKAQAQISKATGADPATAGAFMQGLIAQIGQTVGVPVTDAASATQAVAAVTSQPPEQQAATVAKLETYSLDQLAPLFDKLGDLDRDKWAAQIAGRQSAAAVAAAERWDMTPWLVWMAGGAVTVMLIGFTAAIIYQAIAKDDINTGLIGVAGPLLAIGFGVWREIFGYRFDGTKDSAAQTAIMGQIAQGK